MTSDSVLRVHDIVVGIDESPAAQRALDRALWEATRLGCTVELLHGWSLPVEAGALTGMAFATLPLPDVLQSSAEALVGELLEKAEARAGTQPEGVSTSVVQGDPGRLLAAAAKVGRIVVVGGRGRGYTKSALLGSVTAYVLHHAAGPVMVVPEEGSPAGRFDRVAIGLDGSPGSFEALRWGVGFARQETCPVVVVHAVDPPRLAWSELADFPAFAPQDGDVLSELRQHVADLLPVDHGVEISFKVGHGLAAAALMDEAGPADLLVTGSRGRGGFASLLLGSVATQCSQHARSTVAVVRPTA